MKIKEMQKSYDEVLALGTKAKDKPRRPSILFRTLMRILSSGELKATGFTYTEKGMEKLGKDEPALFLMNHSAFIDLKIASRILYPRPYNIICTSDGFVGKDWLMKGLGCIPTEKFIPDMMLVKDMMYATRILKDSILMYPEASYSFDGTATPLPESLGKLLKVLKVPVVMIRTYGAFHHDPLYNGLRLRDVKVSAEVEYVLSPEDISGKSVDELNAILRHLFTFDSFQWQKDNGVLVKEDFRAEGLSRVLYKCSCCGSEGSMVAGGTRIKCTSCGTEHEMMENGEMKSLSGETRFSHIPAWYRWEREEVRKEIMDGTYRLDKEVEIRVLVDHKAIYHVGKGRLVHTPEGFHLTGAEGKIDFTLAPLDSYSLYSDYYWYEIGDMIAIGTTDMVYYCFPTDGADVAAKTRLATEEIYRVEKDRLLRKA